MAKLTPRVRFWAGMLIGMAVIGVLLSFGVVKRQKGTKAYFCGRCGIRLWVTYDGRAGSSVAASEDRRFEETNLSRWFKTHVSTNCEHVWHENRASAKIYLSLAGQRLWDISGAAGSSATPDIVLLSDEDRAQVEKLLRENPEECRRYIHDRLVEH